MNNTLQAGCYRALPFRAQILADFLETVRQ